MARRLNIDGDGQGDLNGHGGEQRAVLVYQIQSYRYWQRYFEREDFSYGTFGENLTVDGLPDDKVCIGDRYLIGEAEFEVTQPRVTCYRVGLRLGETGLVIAGQIPFCRVRAASLNTGSLPRLSADADIVQWLVLCDVPSAACSITMRRAQHVR